jgi:hypothetical protein
MSLIEVQRKSFCGIFQYHVSTHTFTRIHKSTSAATAERLLSSPGADQNTLLEMQSTTQTTRFSGDAETTPEVPSLICERGLVPGK